MVGVDVTTGTQKFSVVNDGWPAGNMIVAGDGYGYVPTYYFSNCGPTCQVNQLRLLRISSSGTYDTISLFDWTGGFHEVNSAYVQIITNGDTGVLASFGNETGEHFYLATTSGTSVVGVREVGEMIPGQQSAVAPVLQAQVAQCHLCIREIPAWESNISL